jgi:uncharacterized repeat protein (TIGR03803 family)
MKKAYLLISAILCLVSGAINAQLTVLHNFDYTDGGEPESPTLLLGNRLYGTTIEGAANLTGCIYSIDTNGTGFKVVYSFPAANFGGGYTNLSFAGGKFYGIAQGGANDSGIVFSIDTSGANFKDIFNFNGTDGTANGRVQFVISGYKLYGITSDGGANHYGTIFSIDTNGGGFKDMYDFNYTDGAHPFSPLYLVGAKLFGMASYGGPSNDGCIFSIDTSGTGYRDLLDFNGTNGRSPDGPLTFVGGTMYGTAGFGGLYDYGVIFSMDTSGNRYTKLFDFNGLNGWSPLCNFVISGSVMYGIVEFGAANNDGGLFSIDTNGTNFTDLFDFNGTNGQQPHDYLILAGNTFYGTTTEGGFFGYGEIFKFQEANITTSENELKGESEKVKVYPNPFTNSTTISINTAGTNYLELTDVTGRKLKSLEFTGNEYTLSAEGLASGMYFMRIFDRDKNVVGTTKIVVQ